MKPLLLVLAFKLISLTGAILNTIGFLSFFFWPSLAPYRWHMIIGGFALIAVAEIASKQWIKKSQSPTASPSAQQEQT